MFEEHGEIKTFFDLIANRGMVFVTYVRLQRRSGAQERTQPHFSARHSGGREGSGAVARVRDQRSAGKVFATRAPLIIVEFALDRCTLLSPSRRPQGTGS